MTPRRKEFTKELEHYKRVLERRLSMIEWQMARLSHRKSENGRRIAELEARIEKYEEDPEVKPIVRLSDVYQRCWRD